MDSFRVQVYTMALTLTDTNVLRRVWHRVIVLLSHGDAHFSAQFNYEFEMNKSNRRASSGTFYIWQQHGSGSLALMGFQLCLVLG